MELWKEVADLTQKHLELEPRLEALSEGKAYRKVLDKLTELLVILAFTMLGLAGRLSQIPKEEQEKLDVELEWAAKKIEKTPKIKRLPNVAKGGLAIRGGRLKDRRAWLYWTYNKEQEVVQRIYLDDGCVPDNEIAKAFAKIRSRYRQRRPGPPASSRPLFDEFDRRFRAGEDRKKSEKWLLDKLAELIAEEKQADKNDPDIRRLASQRKYWGLRRYKRKV